MTIPRELAFPVEEYRRRVARVHARMADRKLDAIILFGPHNIAYLTGMDSENLFDPQACIRGGRQRSDASHPRFRTGALREQLMAREAGALRPVRRSGHGFCRRHFGRGALPDRSSASISRGIGAQQYQRLVAALPDATVEDSFGVVERVRLVKSSAEIELMRKAASFTDAGVEAGFAAIADGRCDYEVAAAIMEALYGAGSDLTCWGPIVAAGYRSGLAHSAHNGNDIDGRRVRIP